MPGRVSSSTFVGRSAELEELQDALGDTVAGHTRLVFVAGDSGVGKTRLVSEFAQWARGRGARVLCGDCVELGEGELPYAPLVAVLRTLTRDRDPVLRQLPPAALGDLAALLPELADTAHAAPTSADESAQARLFEALLLLLDRAAADAPVLLLTRGPALG